MFKKKNKYKPFDVVYFRHPYGLKTEKAIVKEVKKGSHDVHYIIIPVEGKYAGEEISTHENMLYNEPFLVK